MTEGANNTRRRTRARQKFQPLTKPNSSPGRVNREQWINKICAGFVSPSSANKEYYRVVLEKLWPAGHGVPGPHVTEEQLRQAIDDHRRLKQAQGERYVPYRDPFRRIRELQGEEGVTGIGKEGTRYQLVSLELGPKRKPRVGLSDEDWEVVLKAHGGKCAVCGRMEPEVSFDQDHKIPRTRPDIGGGDELENWQPLCVECNNFKSMQCRGCRLDCRTCGWAFPERYAPLKLSPDNIELVRRFASESGSDPHALLNRLVRDQLRTLRR
jgi:5-methylcytosine-specific restriction endonuclease McrA